MADATTDSLELTDAYQEIIEGACLITIEQGRGGLFHFAASAPAESAPGHSVYVTPGETANVSYPGNLKVYGKRHPRWASGNIKTVVSFTGV